MRNQPTPGDSDYIYPEIITPYVYNNDESTAQTTRHSVLSGDVTVTRGAQLNTPGESTSQISGGEATFTYWTGVDENGIGANPWINGGASSYPSKGESVSVSARMNDSTSLLRFKGYVDDVSGSIQSPTVSISSKDPVDALEKTFSMPALTGKNIPMTVNGTWAGEQDDLLGSWDRRLWTHPATGMIIQGVDNNHRSTLNGNVSVNVPLYRALRRAGFGITPPIAPGNTIASVPFEDAHCLVPEFGAYLKKYTDRTVTYGLTFNGWDRVSTQAYDLHFSMVADGSKLTFRSDDGKVSVSTYWDASINGFVLKNNITGVFTTLVDPYLGPKTSFYRISIEIKRMASAKQASFTLVGMEKQATEVPGINGQTVWTHLRQESSPIYVKPITTAPTGYIGSGGIPFSLSDTATGKPVGGYWEVQYTKAPATTGTRTWMFGGFIINQLHGASLAETYRQNLFSDNHFGGVSDATTPRFENVPVGKLVQDWCSSYCASIWRTTTGALIIKHYTFFSDSSTIEEDAHVVKTDNDWLSNSFSWKESIQEVKSSVVVKYRVPMLSTSATAAPTIVAGNAQNATNMRPGDTFTGKYTPDESHDWIGTSFLGSANQTAQPAVYVDGVPAFSRVDCVKNDPSSTSTEPPWQHVPVQMYRQGMGGILFKVVNNNDYTISMKGLVKYDDGAGGFTNERENTPVAMTHTLVTWKDAQRSLATEPQQDIDPDTGVIYPRLPVVAPGAASAPDGITGSNDVGAGGGARDTDYDGPAPEGEYSHEGNWIFGNLRKADQDGLFKFLVQQASGKTPTAMEIQIYPDSRIEIGDAVDLVLPLHSTLAYDSTWNDEEGTVENSNYRYEVNKKTILKGRIMEIRDVLSNGKWEQFIKVYPFAQ